MNPDIIRFFAAGVFLALGAVFRLVPLPRDLGYGLGLPWTYADETIWHRANRRFGTLLLAWGAWLVVQSATGLPPSWMGSLWAPLVIVTVIAVGYPARLYLERYGTLRVRRVGRAEDPPIPARGGWLVVILREAIPLGALLGTILFIRWQYGAIPDRVPTRWGFADGPTDWRLKDEALTLLRHRTMVVYLVLFLAEGGYLVWRWIRGARRDMAETLLTRSHWMYYLFRLGWVALVSGVNVGFVEHARDGGWAAAWLLPGAAVLSALGVLVGRSMRGAGYAPP